MTTDHLAGIAICLMTGEAAVEVEVEEEAVETG